MSVEQEWIDDAQRLVDEYKLCDESDDDAKLEIVYQIAGGEAEVIEALILGFAPNQIAIAPQSVGGK